MGPFDDLDTRTPQGATKRCTLGQGRALKGRNVSLHFPRQFKSAHFHGSADLGLRSHHQATGAPNRTHHLALDLHRRSEKNRTDEATLARHQRGSRRGG
jgi:hypothetical protein